MNWQIEWDSGRQANRVVRGAWGSCQDRNLVASHPLLCNQSRHLGFDATGTRGITIRYVGDVHDRTVRHNARVPKTLVFVHAHPDDEALLTAGTMAKASAAGHAVHLIVATDGAAGLTSRAYADDLADIRSRELRASADILGVTSIFDLGYSDSGLHAENPLGFAHQPSSTVAQSIATILDDVDADIVVGYDPTGGYGHPDHLHVHSCVRLAWQETDTILFEATLPREPIAKAVHLAARLHLTPQGFDPHEFDHAWTPTRHITHRVNVTSVIKRKRRSLAAHASQAHADNTIRTLGVLSRLPTPLMGAILGREYYIRSDKTSEASVS
jgi:LmbE family N-acetylglucosaminyl deacetylase